MSEFAVKEVARLHPAQRLLMDLAERRAERERLPGGEVALEQESGGGIIQLIINYIQGRTIHGSD